MTEAPRLSDADFAHIVRYAPLVSIDLIITDDKGNAALGLRTNEPAKDYLFVPGGVIRKNERIPDAYRRILKVETGLDLPFEKALFYGPFEHLYDTNRYRDPGYGTHYVVLAYKLAFDHRPALVADSQHTKWVWLSRSDAATLKTVHPNTQAYFK